jgi:hypothetical protein
MKYWKIIADNLSKAGIATTESVSLCERLKN